SDLDVSTCGLDVSDAQRACGFQFLQDECKRIRAPQSRDGMDRDCVGCGIKAMVLLPLQYAKGTGRCAVKALGRPSDPVLFVCEHKQSQEFAAIVHAVPTNGAVAIGRNHQSTVTCDVDPPHRARHIALPEVLTIEVDRPQAPIRSKHESTSIWVDCEAS